MRSFFLVLLRSLARIFGRAAELLARWAGPRETGPEGVRKPWGEDWGGRGEGPDAPAFRSGRRPEAPPRDWLRRASPPPPAHWLEVVRTRAPHFLPLEPGGPERGVVGRDPFGKTERSSPAYSVFAPSEGHPEEKGIAEPGPVLPPGAHPGTPAHPFRASASAGRFRRVVTVVQEVPALKNRKSGKTGESPREALAPVADPGLPPVPAASPGREAEEPRSAGTVAPPPERGGSDFQEVPFLEPSGRPGLEAIQPERRGRDAFPWPASRRPTAWPQLSSREPLSGGASVAPPAGADPGGRAPGWPELPEPPAESLRSLVRAALREAVDHEDLVREQEGRPWNA